MTLKKHLVRTILLAGISALLPHSSSGEDCFDGEEEAEFILFPDTDTGHEIGWVMQCDTDVSSEVVWNVPIGILHETEFIRTANNIPYIRDTACVSVNATCFFTIEDSWGDGLEWPGWFVLIYGATTVATYDWRPFYENVYCFGPNCPQNLNPPIEQGPEYDDLYFFLRLDRNPMETEYSVVCTAGNVIIEGKDFGPQDANQNIEIETYVEPYDCCTLTIRDSAGDGLTDQLPNFEDDFVVYVDWAGNQVLAIENLDSRRFGYLSIDFGNGCDFDEPNIGPLHTGGFSSGTGASGDNGKY